MAEPVSCGLQPGNARIALGAPDEGTGPGNWSLGLGRWPRLGVEALRIAEPSYRGRSRANIASGMDILYHYCSTASFHAITQSHSLWLSALSLSNDTMEGKLVASAIARLAKKDSLDPDTIRRLQDSIGVLEQIMEGLGFCLSEDGD